MQAYTPYEQLKAEWLQANPGASPEQIESNCKDIAERLGL